MNKQIIIKAINMFNKFEQKIAEKTEDNLWVQGVVETTTLALVDGLKVTFICEDYFAHPVGRASEVEFLEEEKITITIDGDEIDKKLFLSILDSWESFFIKMKKHVDWNLFQDSEKKYYKLQLQNELDIFEFIGTLLVMSKTNHDTQQIKYYLFKKQNGKFLAYKKTTDFVNNEVEGKIKECDNIKEVIGFFGSGVTARKMYRTPQFFKITKEEGGVK